MLAIYKKLRDKGPLWAFKRAVDQFRVVLALPHRLIQNTRAPKAAKYASLQPRNVRHAVFVCERLNVRAIKMAYGLREVGWNVTLLHKEVLSFDVSEYFCETRQFTSASDALLIASQYRPVVYHVFALWNFQVSAIFIRYKLGPIVFDNYDLLTGMVKENVLKRYPGQAQLEQYCYLNSDGLCCRDLRVQYLKRVLGYKLPPTLFFPEYCWPEDKVSRSAKLDGIHVVYVGSIETRPDSPVAYLYELAALLSKEGVHLHIYPSYKHVVAELTTNMKRLVPLAHFRDYVHIHDTISPLDIRREISKYHYGLLISSKNVEFGDDNETYFQHQSDYFMAAKMFDYLDAGLFTFTQNARLARFILGKCDGGKVVKSLQDIAYHCKDFPPHDVLIPRSLLLATNITRLTSFYLKLGSTGGIKASALREQGC